MMALSNFSVKLGVYDYLKKPLSVDDLITTVKKGIEQLNILRGSVVNSNSNHKITQINTEDRNQRIENRKLTSDLHPTP